MALLCSSRINKDYLILATIARLRVPQIVISGSENGVKTWHRHAKTVQVMENRIPDSERRQNFLSGGIQHIYRVSYQCFILKFKYHVKCKNFWKKSVSPWHILLIESCFFLRSFSSSERKELLTCVFLQNDP